MYASVLKSASKALELAASALESRSDSVDSWLLFWIVLVVIGAVVELTVVMAEYRHGLADFRRAVIRAPDKPDIRIFILEILGAGWRIRNRH